MSISTAIAATSLADHGIFPFDGGQKRPKVIAFPSSHASNFMSIYLSQNGNPAGPYTLPELEQMRSAGRVSPQDTVLYGENQCTVDEFIQWARFSPDAAHLRPVPTMPPPLPPAIPAPAEVMLPANFISGANGMTVTELAREIFQGGRLVLYPYCVSALILTFRRSSDVMLVRAGKDNFGHTLGYSLVSLTCGWWGIPWGPIFTIGSLFHTAQGGKDVSREVMASLLTREQMNATFSKDRQKPHKGILAHLFPVLLLLLLLTPVALIWKVGTSASSYERANRVAGPGEGQFEAADSSLTRSPAAAGGNSPEAIKLATRMSSMLQEIRDKYATGTPSGDFKTYCELHGKTCAFLVFVPELKNYNSDAKKQFGEAAWTCGELMLSQLPEDKRPAQLAVATRGRLLYDLAWVGPVAPDAQASLKKSGFDSKSALYSFFAP